MNKPSCQVWKKLAFGWLVDNLQSGLFGQRPQHPWKALGLLMMAAFVFVLEKSKKRN
jgi:hypothetical protein